MVRHRLGGGGGRDGRLLRLPARRGRREQAQRPDGAAVVRADLVLEHTTAGRRRARSELRRARGGAQCARPAGPRPAPRSLAGHPEQQHADLRRRSAPANRPRPPRPRECARARAAAARAPRRPLAGERAPRLGIGPSPRRLAAHHRPDVGVLRHAARGRGLACAVGRSHGARLAQPGLLHGRRVAGSAVLLGCDRDEPAGRGRCDPPRRAAARAHRSRARAQHPGRPSQRVLLARATHGRQQHESDRDSGGDALPPRSAAEARGPRAAASAHADRARSAALRDGGARPVLDRCALRGGSPGLADRSLRAAAPTLVPRAARGASAHASPGTTCRHCRSRCAPPTGWVARPVGRPRARRESAAPDPDEARASAGRRHPLLW